MTVSVTPQVSTRYPNVTLADVLDELRREAAARQRTYPQMIARGNMQQADADHQQAIIAALIEDVTRYSRVPVIKRLDPPTHSFNWYQRRAAITRELEYRARVYPRWIETGRLQQADADQATRRLSAWADIYDDGFDWHARNGLRIFHGRTPTSAAEHEAQQEWFRHYDTIMQARGLMSPAQEALAL